MLYEFEKKHPDFDGISFCIRALADKGDVRNHVTRLCVDSGFMIATDGSRLHKYGTVLDDGYYRPLVFTDRKIIVYHEAENKADYPNWRKLFDAAPNIQDCEMTDVCFDDTHSSGSFAIVLRLLNDKYAVNIDYLKDLGDYFKVAICSSEGEKKDMIYFESGKKSALIMPMTA